MLKRILYILILLSIKTIAQEPNPPVIDTVSVEPVNVKGDVYISWEAMDPNEVAGYIIYRDLKTSLDLENWENLDTVWGANNTSYIDQTSNADGEYEFYIMRSFNHQGDKSLLSQSFSTIYTFPYIEKEDCKNLIRVHWDYHQHWQVSFNHFDIYCSKDYGPYQKVGTVDGSLRDFKYFDVNDQTSYSFFVRATLANGKTVTSNSVRTYTNFPSVTKYLNADYATVENKAIKLEFLLDDSADVRNYTIVRSDSINGVYKPIYTINNYLPKFLVYYDTKADIYTKHYYKIQAVDLCGNSYFESNLAQNIVINVSSNDDFQPVITWDTYNSWLGGVKQYNLYRIINDQKTLIYTTYNAINYFKDNIPDEELRKLSSNLCYEVEVVEGDGNPYGIRGVSKSAKKCITQEAKVFVPNAFTPDNNKINDSFKPSLLFVSPENYVFEIYDRWGMLIFRTTDIDKAWEGKLESGKYCPEGSYVYYIVYQDFYGNVNTISGTVSLLRY